MNVIFITVSLISFILFLYLLVKRIILEKKVKELKKEIFDLTQDKVLSFKFLMKICSITESNLKKINDYASSGIVVRDDKKTIVKNFVNTQETAQKLSFMVKDIIDLIEIDNGQFKIQKKTFSLQQLISSIFVIFYEESKQKKLFFDSDFSDMPQELFGDSVRLTQILINLLSNAIKFSKEKGTVIFRVKRECRNDKEFLLVITIQDDGIGMSPEQVDCLFDYKTIVSNQNDSPGLSLYLTKKIIEQMDGELLITSVVNGGTSFVIKLPFINEPDTIQKEETSYIDFTSFNILIADSDVSSAEYSQLLFSDFNISSDIVTTTTQLFDFLNKPKNYSLCLIDLSLMNDLVEFEETIKHIKRLQNITIVILSKNDYSSFEKMGYELGVHTFITKPLFLTTISNLLMSVFGHIESIDATNSVDLVHYKGHKVLLIEDNEMSREIILELLSKLEISVDFVENGKDAVNAFMDSRRNEYSMIFMDVSLPDIDGYQAIEMIRKSKHPKAKDICIVAMDVNIKDYIATNDIELKINDFLQKPIQVEKMYTLLQKYLEI